MSSPKNHSGSKLFKFLERLSFDTHLVVKKDLMLLSGDTHSGSRLKLKDIHKTDSIPIQLKRFIAGATILTQEG